MEVFVDAVARWMSVCGVGRGGGWGRGGSRGRGSGAGAVEQGGKRTGGEKDIGFILRSYSIYKSACIRCFPLLWRVTLEALCISSK